MLYLDSGPVYLLYLGNYSAFLGESIFHCKFEISLPTGFFVVVAFLLSAGFFLNQFLKNIVSGNTIRVSNNLDPGQARRFVGPDRSSNCLQSLSAAKNYSTLIAYSFLASLFTVSLHCKFEIIQH